MLICSTGTTSAMPGQSAPIPLAIAPSPPPSCSPLASGGPMAGRGRRAGPSRSAKGAPMDPLLVQAQAPAITRVLESLAALKAELTPDVLLYHELSRTEETLRLLMTLAQEAATLLTTSDPLPPL